MKPTLKSSLLGATFAILSYMPASSQMTDTSLDDLIAAAKAEGTVNSLGMPDSWANWKGTWRDLHDLYGLEHFDSDMSSAQELSKFENEKHNATGDIGDVGIEFGPIAVSRDLVQPYKPTTWDQIPDWAKDDDGNWVLGYTGTIAFIIDASLEDAPESWADLLTSDYKFSINGVGQAAQANATVLAAAIAMGGGENDLEKGVEVFAELARQGRLVFNDVQPATMERGEVQIGALWDFNALNYRDQVGGDKYRVIIPSDGSVTSGYATIINKYAKHPNAAKLAREYILSDAGQLNLANGYARPIRIDHITLTEETAQKMLPAEQYKAARPIDSETWQKTAPSLTGLWQDYVLSEM